MGGVDTRGRYHVHWGAAETYAERREELALRRSGRSSRTPRTHRSRSSTSRRSTRSLRSTIRPRRGRCDILEATQTAYGYLPVAALKRIAHRTGAWDRELYGTASSYPHLRFEPAASAEQAKAVDEHRPAESTYLAALDAALDGGGRPGAPARA